MHWHFNLLYGLRSSWDMSSCCIQRRIFASWRHIQNSLYSGTLCYLIISNIKKELHCDGEDCCTIITFGKYLLFFYLNKNHGFQKYECTDIEIVTIALSYNTHFCCNFCDQPVVLIITLCGIIYLCVLQCIKFTFFNISSV